MLFVSIGARGGAWGGACVGVGVGVGVGVCTVLIDIHAPDRVLNGNRGGIRRRISAILDNC
jgi:hypothetical protein